MKNVHGVWLPDHEEHLLAFAKEARWKYQDHKYELCKPWIKNWRNSIDVGGHCGLWAMEMCKEFRMVHSFEPVSEHRRCYIENMRDRNLHNYRLYDCALGEKKGFVSIHTSEGSSGDSWVEGAGSIPVVKLDSFEWPDPVDFIKLDCEGYEYFALKGGEELLLKNRPCVIVEQKPGRAQKFGLREKQAVEYLEKLGAVLRDTISGDYILSWDKE